MSKDEPESNLNSQFHELLLEACERGELEIVKNLVAENPKLIESLNNAQDQRGYTALHIAVKSDQPEIVEFLLSKGADPNSQDSLGNLPLNSAIIKEQKGVAQALINGGADIEALDKFGQTPLQLAASYKQEEIAQSLVQKGANVNNMGRDGIPPLHSAIGERYRVK